MFFSYDTKGVCTRKITMEIEGDIIKNVEFKGGCNGNAKGICALVKGMKVDDVISRCQNIDCNGRGTSCPDQLAKALRDATRCVEAQKSTGQSHT